MSTQVTIRMSAQDFDTLRKAVALAQGFAKNEWRILEQEGATATNHPQYKEYHEWLNKEAEYNHLIENVLS